jgi:16S rRNA processing protein RimM
MAAIEKSEYLAVAKLGSVRGLDGALKLISYSGEYSPLEAVREILIGGSLGLPDAQPIVIQQVSKGGWGASIVFEGFETPERARTLVGRELFLRRSQACPKSPHEYYIADLIGMKAHISGSPVGEIVGVIPGNASDFLEIRKLDGRVSLVPFQKEFVGKVDEEKGEIEILNRWILE